MKYRFSFTGANAMLPEFIQLAELIHQGESIDNISNEYLGREKGATNKREFQELRHRLNALTPTQIEILAEGSMDEQKQITHLALCKTYGIYHDFVTEVLAEKIQVYDYTLTELDYNSFISKKSVDHPELERIAQTTQKKVKQVIFRMLQQVGMIDYINNPTILTPVVHSKVEEAIKADDPKLLNCFLIKQEE